MPIKAPTPTCFSAEKFSWCDPILPSSSTYCNLANKSEPLHKLLRKKVDWEWKEDQEEAFVVVNRMLTNPEFLIPFDPELHIVIHCDASLYGLGEVL